MKSNLLSTRVIYLIMVFAAIFMSGVAEMHASRPAKLDKALSELDAALSRMRVPYLARVARIDSLKTEVSMAQVPDYVEYMRLGDAYVGVSTDSAMIYYYRAEQAAEAARDTMGMRRASIELASQLSKSAIFPYAMMILDSISPDSFDRRGRLRYYQVAAQIYIDASQVHSLDYLKDLNKTRAVAALDSMAVLLPPGSIARRLTDAQIQYVSDNPTMALGELNEVFETLPSESPAYAIAAGMLARYYRGNPEKEDEYLYYLTLSSIADANAANGEMASLMHLGREFFRIGDLDRAFRYLSTSSEAIHRSGSKVLYSELAPTITVLIESMRKREIQRTGALAIWLAITVLVLVVCAVMLWYIARRNRRDKSHTEQLSASLTSRDIYISRLLELCSVYVEGLEDFNRLVGRKLKANQTQDLYKLIESGKVLQDNTERFFTIFDSAVFNIYPDFLKDVNSLLQPDKQVTLPSEDRLSPELRIVAFMRMGVTESSRLSKFLGLSLNTIYTYRNRMKNRAIDREKFESQIMQIGV